MTTKTYTIAYDGFGLLWACVPDGADVMAAVAHHADQGRIDMPARDDLTIDAGLTLTDDEDGGDIRFEAGSHTGWLTDETGASYLYAVHA